MKLVQIARNGKLSLGVQTAYCMDGGNSSIMLFNGKYYDANYADSEREQSDIIYIATAVPDGQ